MEFSTIKQRLADDDLPDDAYSYDVEQDFWEWEDAERLKRCRGIGDHDDSHASTSSAGV